MSATTIKTLALGLAVLIVVVAWSVLFGGGDDQRPQEQGSSNQQSGNALDSLDQAGERTSPQPPTTAERSQPVEGEPVAEEGGDDQPEPEYADLSQTQEQRVRGTVSTYIVSAYGYSGSDTTIYARGVERNVVLPQFYDSAGGAWVKDRVGDVEDGGTQSAAVLERFEIEQVGSGEIVGTAYYTIGDSYDSGGTKVKGGGASYRERITLVPQQSVYKIRESTGPQEVGR